MSVMAEKQSDTPLVYDFKNTLFKFFRPQTRMDARPLFAT